MLKKDRQSAFSRNDHQVEVGMISRLLDAEIRRRGGTAYFMTMTFDPYRKLYLTIGGTEMQIPNRLDVAMKITRAMPADAILEGYQADLRRFYLRLARALLGRGYAAKRDRQPFALGWLDSPVGKGVGKRSTMARRAGDVFDHAHFIIVMDDRWQAPTGETVHERFLSLFNSGAIQKIWQRFNPSGEVHLKPVSNLQGAVDYAAKTAKRKLDFVGQMSQWPFA